MTDMTVEHVGLKRIKSVRLSFDRILFVIFAVTFSTLLISQTAFLFPSIRLAFVNQNLIEGSIMADEEYLYSKGAIELKLLYLGSCPDLRILLNGEDIGNFTENIVRLDVIDGDVIEIDSSEAIGDTSITITPITNNISSEEVAKGRFICHISK